MIRIIRASASTTTSTAVIRGKMKGNMLNTARASSSMQTLHTSPSPLLHPLHNHPKQQQKVEKTTYIPSLLNDQQKRQYTSTTPTTNIPTPATKKFLTPREIVNLEQHILTSFNNASSSSSSELVLDPILEKHIGDANKDSLNWIKSISTTTTKDDNDEKIIKIKVALKLPSLLHPSLSTLTTNMEHFVKTSVDAYFLQEENKKREQFQTEVHVQIATHKPQPFVRNTRERDELVRKLGPGLAHVAHFVAVYSCKGGVGKSTVAVNLAYELARMGGRVGLLDVDIYGPSLPVLIEPDDPTVRRSELGSGMVKPIEHRGVKLLSLGFVSPKSGVPGSGPDGGAAVMRGPMAGRVVTQLLKGTDWGDLDILVLDLPLGTGDVQLAICQDLQLSGAVSVTTPSKLAVTDARKGIDMFTSLGVPTLAAVENMAFFECEGGGKHYPFGKGILDSLPELGLKSSRIFQLPISTNTNNANDSGSPLCLARPKNASLELGVFSELAKAVSTEILLLEHGSIPSSEEGTGNHVSVSFENESDKFDVASTHLSVDNGKGTFTVRLFSDSGALQIDIAGEELRRRHPKTGEELTLDEDESVPNKQGGCGGGADGIVEHHKHKDSKKARLFPAKIDKKGRYGYSVEWADGATIIYSMMSICKAAGGR